MGIPPNTASLLEGNPERGWYATDVECEGAKFHSPTPLTVEDVFLCPDTNGPTATLCPTCAANLRVLTSLLVKTSGDLPWPVRREFGNQLRALAEKGWEWYVRSTSG